MATDCFIQRLPFSKLSPISPTSIVREVHAGLLESILNLEHQKEKPQTLSVGQRDRAIPARGDRLQSERWCSC